MRGWIAGLVIGLALGCGRGEPEQAVAGDSTTQRMRDSALGASGLPGATGISASLKVADSASARRQREDSIAMAP